MLTSQDIVEKLGLKRKGQQLFWEDYDDILLHTPYKETDDFRFNRRWIAHWWMNLYKGDYTRVDYDTVYKIWSAARYKVFKHCYPDSHWSDTMQSCVILCVPKKKKLHRVSAELNFWFPYITPSVEKGDIRYNIFEHTLSEGGSYSLLIKPDMSKLTLTICRYSRISDVYTCNSLQTMLEYMQRHHYYE